MQGVNDLQAAAEQKFGPGDYIPNLAVTYWSFRLMIGLGMVSFARGARRAVAVEGPADAAQPAHGPGRRSRPSVLPFLANSFGWIFTEMGRQPWVVVPNPTGLDAVRLLTRDGVSPSVGAYAVVISLVSFTLVYGLLAVVELRLLLRYAKAGLPEDPVPGAHDDADQAERPMAFAY